MAQVIVIDDGLIIDSRPFYRNVPKYRAVASAQELELRRSSFPAIGAASVVSSMDGGDLR